MEIIQHYQLNKYFPEILENDLYTKLREKAFFASPQVTKQTKRAEKSGDFYEKQLLNLMGSSQDGDTKQNAFDDLKAMRDFKKAQSQIA
jgi:hypothetical protein